MLVEPQDIERIVKQAIQLGDYPAAVDMMFEAGIERYHTDIRSHTLTYFAGAISYVEHGEALTSPGQGAAEDIGIDELKAAIEAHGRGQLDYRGFLEALYSSGVESYTVDLARRTISYANRLGSTHIVPVPQTNKSS